MIPAPYDIQCLPNLVPERYGTLPSSGIILNQMPNMIPEHRIIFNQMPNMMRECRILFSALPNLMYLVRHNDRFGTEAGVSRTGRDRP